jgi:lipopolysaccharide/colanic/teichoic acid biosynthesis glycosyltransferase
MDLLLPKLVQKEKRFPARFNFRYYSSPSPKQADFQYSGFFYIGKNDGHIEKLVGIYKRGHVCESVEKVKEELLRISVHEGNFIPEVIICDAEFGTSATRQLCQFVRKHPVFGSIPFVLEGSCLSGNELRQFRNSARPDEILRFEAMDETAIGNKVQFLRKIKAAREKVATPQIEESMSARHSFLPTSKRAFDILVAAIALLVLSPLFLLISIVIRLESRGPIFYIAKRAGRGYKIFNFYKFRTMVVDADSKITDLVHLNQYGGESKGPVFFKLSDDPRVTRFGKFLRNTSLDELPQFINVFLGHMSLVGNRPLPLYEAQELTTDEYAARFMAPAGITGLWQVKKRGSMNMSAEERINIDIAYAAKCDFATDLWIIANTPSALLQKANV